MSEPIQFPGARSPSNSDNEALAWSVVDSIVEGILIIDDNGTILRANDAVAMILGYEKEQLVGRNVSMLMPDPVRGEHDGYISEYLSTGRTHIIGVAREVNGRHRDGQLIPIELSVSEANHGQQRVFVGVLRDIAERKDTEKILRTHNKVMRTVNIALANAINDGVSKREIFNTVLLDLLDITESEYGFIGEILHKNDLPYLKTHAITNIAWNYETRKFYRDNVKNGLDFSNLETLFGVTIRTGQMVIANDPDNDPRRGGLPKGHPRLNKYLGLPIYSGNKLLGMAGIANRAAGYDEDLVEQIKPLLGAIGTIIASHQNMQSKLKAEEELHRAQQRLKQMATKDPVTGIANRYMLVQELEAAYEQCLGQKELTVLFIDVDRFKLINDTHGHDAGDVVLKSIAERLANAIRPTDVVGRYGGEEFIVGLPRCTLDHGFETAERMRADLAAMVCKLDDGLEIKVTASIGIASLSQQPKSLDELMRWADAAVYQAKDDGRNCVRIHRG